MMWTRPGQSPLAERADAGVVGVQDNQDLAVVARAQLAHLAERWIPGDLDAAAGLRDGIGSGGALRRPVPAPAPGGGRARTHTRVAHLGRHRLRAGRLRHPRQVVLELEREARELERLRLARRRRKPVLRPRADVLEQLLPPQLEPVLVRAEAVLPRLAQVHLEVRGGDALHQLDRLLDEAVRVADERAVVDDAALPHQSAVDVVRHAVDLAAVLDHVGELACVHVLDHRPVLPLAPDEDLAPVPDAGRVALGEDPAELVERDPRRLAMDVDARAGGHVHGLEVGELAAARRPALVEVREVLVAQALLPVNAQPPQLPGAQGRDLGLRTQLAQGVGHPHPVAPEHAAAPPRPRALAEADRVVDVLHAGAVVRHRDGPPPELDPHLLRVRVERVVDQLADHVVRLVIRHALGEDHVRDGRGFAAAVVALHG